MQLIIYNLLLTLSNVKQKTALAISVVALVLIIDQCVKLYIKTHFILGEEINVFSWFKIHFVENQGMAFGMELGGDHGKFALTSFRILALGGIVYMLRQLINKPETSMGMVACIALILAGAAGNIIDSIIYGILFSDSVGQVAKFLPAEGGYAPLLHGKVVDMLYFPLYDGFLPNWIPFWGSKYFMFFRPVFNVADSAISIGVAMLLLFQRSFFATVETPPKAESQPTTEPNTDQQALNNERSDINQ